MTRYEESSAHGKGETGFLDATAGRKKEKKKNLTTFITTMRTKEDYAKVKTNLNESERN